MALIIKDIKFAQDSIEKIATLELDDLEKAILYAADKYYNTGNPVISDALYDVMIDFLKLKNPKSSVLKTVGSKVKSKNKVQLDYWLGSMDKIKPPSKHLSIWCKSYKPPYYISDKLDGVSALLIYKNDMINMYTRGSATEGVDITPLIKYLKNIPDYKKVINYCKHNKIHGDKNIIAFRGELVFNESIFQTKWSSKFKNSRNTISGLVNSKIINPELASDVELVIYEIIDPFYTIDRQYNIITDLNFNLVNHIIYKDNLSYDYLSKYFKKRRNDAKYMIDGIIVTDIKNNIRNVDGNPIYAFAFKDILDDQIAITKVLGIEWNASKDGYLNPTLILEPVIIGSVLIKRVTAHNAKFIVEHVLGVGAIIELIRSGDVIPYIKKVLKPCISGVPELPDKKIFNWSWNNTQVDIILNNINDNIDVNIKSIHHFFDTLGTVGMGEKTVSKLVNSGFDTIPKILSLTQQQLLQIDGFQIKSVIKLLSNINKSTIDIPLYKIMVASNKLGHGLGCEKIKQLLSKYPNILYHQYDKNTFIQNIKNIDGWHDKTALLLYNNLNTFIDFFNSIKKYVSIQPINKIKIKNKLKFDNMIFVLTGFRDKDLQNNIEELGGTIANTVSKNTTYLIVKDQNCIDEPTTKIKKAQELGITIITKNNFLKMITN